MTPGARSAVPAEQLALRGQALGCRLFMTGGVEILRERHREPADATPVEEHSAVTGPCGPGPGIDVPVYPQWQAVDEVHRADGPGPAGGTVAPAATG